MSDALSGCQQNEHLGYVERKIAKFPLSSNYILWTCLNASRRKLYNPTTWITKPYLVGKTHPQLGERIFRCYSLHLGPLGHCRGANRITWARRTPPYIAVSQKLFSQHSLSKRKTLCTDSHHTTPLRSSWISGASYTTREKRGEQFERLSTT